MFVSPQNSYVEAKFQWYYIRWDFWEVTGHEGRGVMGVVPS